MNFCFFKAGALGCAFRVNPHPIQIATYPGLDVPDSAFRIARELPFELIEKHVVVDGAVMNGVAV